MAGEASHGPCPEAKAGESLELPQSILYLPLNFLSPNPSGFNSF